jgi:ketosteroid isomerase-like protein
MSQENVEIVREVMILLSQITSGGDADAEGELLRRFDPDVRIDMTRRVFNPDVYVGHEGLRRLAREVGAVWEEFTIEPERLIDGGDRIVVIERRRGRGAGSGLAVEQTAAVIWTLEDGRVIAAETDLDPEEALESVGLTE